MFEQLQPCEGKEEKLLRNRMSIFNGGQITKHISSVCQRVRQHEAIETAYSLPFLRYNVASEKAERGRTIRDWVGTGQHI